MVVVTAEVSIVAGRPGYVEVIIVTLGLDKHDAIFKLKKTRQRIVHLGTCD